MLRTEGQIKYEELHDGLFENENLGLIPLKFLCAINGSLTGEPATTHSLHSQIKKCLGM